jgi:hypothetical protein
VITVTEDRQRVGDIVETPLVKPEIISQLRDVGVRCANIDFVPDWIDANNERARADVEQCIVASSGDAPVVVGDFFPIAESLGAWLTARADNGSAKLQLEASFRVPNIEGGMPFVQQIRDLTSIAMYDTFRDRFQRYTYISLAVTILLLALYAVVYASLRARELLNGSEHAARVRRIVEHSLMVVSGLAVIAPFIMFISA